MATYLITQAAGIQSLLIIQHLLKTGAKIHAVVRNPDKQVETLKHPNVSVFKGSSTDFEAVYEAAKGCQGVFINTYPVPPGLEEQQATTLASAARKAGIDSAVVATTFFTGDRSAWDDDITKKAGLHEYWLSKAVVEDVVRKAGFKTLTILRPAFLSNDYIPPWVAVNYPELAETGELVHSFEDGVKWLHLDPDVVGQFGALALLEPERLNGEAIEMGVEMLTIEETRDIIERVSGKKVPIRKRTEEELKAATVLMAGFQVWASHKDLTPSQKRSQEAADKYGIRLPTLEEYLTREKAGLLECLSGR